MKHIKNLLKAAFVAVLAWFSSCTGMYDNIDKYSSEVVYPGKYDTISGKVGFERIELDLMQAGRISQEQIKLGKAVSTVVEYDDEEHKYPLCSWVNITDLKQSKLYRFKVYTVDEKGNKSVPQEIALIAYTSIDRDLIDISSPKISSSPSSAVIDWPNGLNSVIMDYISLEYEYTSRDGETVQGSLSKGVAPRIFVNNLEPGSTDTIKVKMRVVPIVSDAIRLIDTIEMVRNIVLNMPVATTPFAPSEEAVLRANGISTFTAASVADVEKLVFPLHISSLQDVFYFPALKELDLTGEGLDNVVPTFRLSGNGGDYTPGGGAWLPCMKRSENQGTITITGIQSLIDLLENGTLEKVRYIPNSMGLDAILAPYVASGVVELVGDSDPLFPAEIRLPYRFWMEGRPQTTAFKLIWRYPLPVSEVMFPSSLENPNEVYFVTPEARNGTFAFMLPKEYIWDLERYPYFKFKVLASSEASTFDGAYDQYLRMWMRIKTRLWGVDSNNDLYGDDKEKNYDRESFKIPQANIQTRWTEFTVDLSSAVNDTKNDTGHHIRVIVLNIGGEPGGMDDNNVLNQHMEFQFADFKLCKNR
ncbi:MAG: DUF4998 domain-containing protein [Prevotellaceae bacterium]|jgi:hypothetical protein|nr:DUF4998 domain-containing protein [Prevotellaceae bacterium]